MARTTNGDRGRRMTAISGLILVVLGIMSTVLPLFLPHAEAGDTAPQIAAYLTGQRGSLLFGMYSVGLGWGGLLLVFTSGLYAILARAEGDPSPLALLGFAGGLVVAAIALMFAALGATAVYQLAAVDPAGARVVYQLFFMVVNFGAFPTIVNVLPFSMVMLRTGVVPRWIGWIGVAAALAHLVASVSLAAQGPMSPSGIVPALAPVVYLVWALCTSIVLLRPARI